MIERGQHTFSEIMSQPRVWADALAVYKDRASDLTRFWAEAPVDQAIFTGCGSTHYLAMTAATVFKRLTGLSAMAYPGSELVLFPELVYTKSSRALLVAISRSGETTETLEAIPIFRERVGGKVIAITCDSASALARQADLILAVDSAQEESVAQTRSFTSMAVLAQALAAHVGGQDAGQTLAALPGIVKRLLEDYQDIARDLGEDTGIERYFFLGSGSLHGIAQEAMLKMKEMSISYSEAFHTLEFRHGPMSMVDERALVVGLVSESAAAQEIAVLRDMHTLGGRVLSLVEASGADTAALGQVIQLESGLPPWARPVLYLPALQLIAYYRAMSRGQNPDRPNNLESVVRLKALH